MYDGLFWETTANSEHIIYLLKEKATTKCFREGVGPPQGEQLLVIDSVKSIGGMNAILPTDIPPFGVFMMVVDESLV